MHATYKYLLFDLDGTLMDSREGLTNSIAYVLEAFGLPPETKETLTSYLGPTIDCTFRERYGFSPEKAREAVAVFREHFPKKDMLEGNRFFEGIPELLKDLKAAGYKMAIATSKYEVFTDAIAEHFQLLPYFDAIVGSNDQKDRPGKTEVIAEALKALAPDDLKEVLMIGDRKTDMTGAAINGIDALGILYGYGEREELTSAIYIAESVADLRKFLLP